MPTLKDIAKITGCSTAAISRVLNNDMNLSVTQEVKDRIFEAAEQLHYVLPKHRHVTQEEKYCVGVLVWYTEYEEMDYPYYVSIRHGIEQKCAEKNIALEILYIDKNNEEKLDKIDGLILVGKFTIQYIAQMEQFVDNIVLVDYVAKNHDSIVVDFEDAMQKSLSYMESLGHTEIGLLIKEEVTSGETLIDPRLTAFCNYLGVSHDNKNIHKETEKSNGGYTIMNEAIEQGDLPTAFFCASDGIALGAMRAAREHGFEIPKDISFVGFGDLTQSKYLYPSLTTVRVETEFMGELAVDTMYRNLKQKKLVTQKIVLSTTLIKRESVAQKK